MKRHRIKAILELYASFFKVGAMTFGGGYAMLPILQREVVDRKGWVSEEELLDYYAIGQSTPGIIAINTATFVGFKHGGVLGALLATLGIITPSLFIIMIIASVLLRFQDNPIVMKALKGINISVAVLLIHVVTRFWRKAVVDKLTLFIALLSFSLVMFTPLSPIWMVTGSIVCGLLYHLARSRRR